MPHPISISSPSHDASASSPIQSRGDLASLRPDDAIAALLHPAFPPTAWAPLVGGEGAGTIRLPYPIRGVYPDRSAAMSGLSSLKDMPSLKDRERVCAGALEHSYVFPLWLQFWRDQYQLTEGAARLLTWLIHRLCWYEETSFMPWANYPDRTGRSISTAQGLGQVLSKTLISTYEAYARLVPKLKRPPITKVWAGHGAIPVGGAAAYKAFWTQGENIMNHIDISSACLLSSAKSAAATRIRSWWVTGQDISPAQLEALLEAVPYMKPLAIARVVYHNGNAKVVGANGGEVLKFAPRAVANMVKAVVSALLLARSGESATAAGARLLYPRAGAPQSDRWY